MPPRRAALAAGQTLRWPAGWRGGVKGGHRWAAPIHPVVRDTGDTGDTATRGTPGT